MSNDDRDLEALLRQALRERADLVQPAGDGLAKIRERAARRRRRMAWLRPGIAAVAAALAILAAVGIPALLNRSGPPGQDAASQPTASHSATPRAKATPKATATPQSAAPTPTAQQPGATQPSVAPNRVVGVPVWPYGSSADAMASASANPELTDPAALAKKFVEAFVYGARLTTQLSYENSKTATVQVIRSDLSRPVCTVELQRVSPKSAAYVVTAAQTDHMTMKPVGPLMGANSVKVVGTLRSDPSESGNLGNVYSAILVPDGTTQAKRITAQPGSMSGSQQDQSWSVTVNPPKRIAQPGIVAAWTVDLNGEVLDFAAQPAD